MPSATTPSQIRINFFARGDLPTPERDVLYFPSKGWYIPDGRLAITPEEASWHLRIMASDGGWVTSLKEPRGMAKWFQAVDGGQSGKEVILLEESGGWTVEVSIQREE